MKKGIRKRIMATLLAGTMCMIALPQTVFAAEIEATSNFVDMPQNWATESIKNAVKNRLLTGYDVEGKKYIKPSGELTRAEMAVIVSNAFGAVEQGDISGATDVPKEAWFAADMGKALYMEAFTADSRLRPNDKITREEAMTVLARVLFLEGNDGTLDRFSDGKEVSVWAAKEISAMIEKGHIKGIDGSINPQKHITRAEFAKIMDSLVTEYISVKGTISNKTINGSVMINAPGIILKDSDIKGSIILGDGIAEGDITLDHVTVSDKLIVRGGGAHTIRIKGGTKVATALIGKPAGNERILVEKGSSIKELSILKGRNTVTLEGSFGNVKVDSQTPIALNNTIVENLNILKKAKDTQIVVSKESEISNMEIRKGADNIKLIGEGKLKTADVKGNDADIKLQGVKINVAEGVKGTKYLGKELTTTEQKKPKEVKKPSSNKGGGSSGGSSGGRPKPEVSVTPSKPQGLIFKDGVWKGQSYGRVLDKMQVLVTIKDGKVAEVQPDLYSDTYRIEKKLIGSGFYKKFKGKDPKDIANAIWAKREYWEMIEEAGEGNYTSKAQELLGDYARSMEDKLNRASGENFPRAEVQALVQKFVREKMWEDIDAITGATTSGQNIANAAVDAVSKAQRAEEKNPTLERPKYQVLSDAEKDKEILTREDVSANSTLHWEGDVLKGVISYELKAEKLSKFRGNLIPEDFYLSGAVGGLTVKKVSVADNGKKLNVSLGDIDSSYKGKKLYTELVTSTNIFDRRAEATIERFRVPVDIRTEKRVSEIGIKDFGEQNPALYPQGNYVYSQKTYLANRTTNYTVVNGKDFAIVIYPKDEETKESFKKYADEFMNKEAVITIDGKRAEYESELQRNYTSIKLKIDSGDCVGEFDANNKTVEMNFYSKGFQNFTNMSLDVFNGKLEDKYFCADELELHNNLSWQMDRSVFGSIDIVIPKEKAAIFDKNIIEEQLKEFDHTMLFKLTKAPDGLKLSGKNIKLSEDNRKLSISFEGNASEKTMKELQNIELQIAFHAVNGYMYIASNNYIGESLTPYFNVWTYMLPKGYDKVKVAAGIYEKPYTDNTEAEFTSGIEIAEDTVQEGYIKLKLAEEVGINWDNFLPFFENLKNGFGVIRANGKPVNYQLTYQRNDEDDADMPILKLKLADIAVGPIENDIPVTLKMKAMGYSREQEYHFKLVKKSIEKKFVTRLDILGENAKLNRDAKGVLTLSSGTVLRVVYNDSSTSNINLNSDKLMIKAKKGSEEEKELNNITEAGEYTAVLRYTEDGVTVSKELPLIVESKEEQRLKSVYLDVKGEGYQELILAKDGKIQLGKNVTIKVRYEGEAAKAIGLDDKNLTFKIVPSGMDNLLENGVDISKDLQEGYYNLHLYYADGEERVQNTEGWLKVEK